MQHHLENQYKLDTTLIKCSDYLGFLQEKLKLFIPCAKSS